MVDVETILPSGRVESDPALLAFLKCHVTSFLRWDILAFLVGSDPGWLDPSEIAREIQKPEANVQAVLVELATEGLVAARRGPGGRLGYRMDPDEPTTRVVERLVSTATRSQELRRMIVARVVRGAQLAS
jgi:predicted transcriptional regulator